jgi:tetratricopeptide (TPR) repeat protein
VDFDHGISSAINRLRDALGDSADNPIFIETVERRGYRWIAPTYVPTPVPFGPVLVKPSVKDLEIRADAPKPVHIGWGWILVLPLMALILAFWSFRPTHPSAKAAVTKPAVGIKALDSVHHSTQAQEFYLKGRFYWQKRTPDGLNKAVDSFTQAIVNDPTFAPAYVGLADCYNLLREYTLMPASDAYPRALAAARKAVELDDQSSEAHASLAFALFYGMWDAENAEHEFRRAIELNPDNAIAHHWYATYLSTVGRHAESLAEINRAQTLDPSSKAILADKGDLLILANQRDAGLALLKQLEATEPDFISPHRYLKGAYFAAGDYAGYLAEWKKEATLMRDSSTLKLVEIAEHGYAEGGTRSMLENMQEAQRKLYKQSKFSPYLLAETNSLLGNKQQALQYLKTAYDQHDEHMVGIKGDPAFASLQNDPAYRDLVAKLGLFAHN